MAPRRSGMVMGLKMLKSIKWKQELVYVGDNLFFPQNGRFAGKLGHKSSMYQTLIHQNAYSIHFKKKRTPILLERVGMLYI